VVERSDAFFFFLLDAPFLFLNVPYFFRDRTRQVVPRLLLLTLFSPLAHWAGRRKRSPNLQSAVPMDSSSPPQLDLFSSDPLLLSPSGAKCGRAVWFLSFSLLVSLFLSIRWREIGQHGSGDGAIHYTKLFPFSSLSLVSLCGGADVLLARLYFLFSPPSRISAHKGKDFLIANQAALLFFLFSFFLGCARSVRLRSSPGDPFFCFFPLWLGSFEV